VFELCISSCSTAHVIIFLMKPQLGNIFQEYGTEGLQTMDPPYIGKILGLIIFFDPEKIVNLAFSPNSVKIYGCKQINNVWYSLIVPLLPIAQHMSTISIIKTNFKGKRYRDWKIYNCITLSSISSYIFFM